jgi:cell division protein DivIC
MKIFSRFPRWLASKYLIAITAFIVWMFFFDKNDLGLQSRRRDELKKLRQSETELAKQISQSKVELNLLKTNSATIEKYAREKYFMKKDNEDLYIYKEE